MLLYVSIIAVGMTLSKSDAGEVIFDFDSVEVPEYEYFYDENGQKQKVCKNFLGRFSAEF